MATSRLDQQFPAEYRNCLIDMHDDRRHRHASGQGERNDHSYEYFCHAHPGTFAIEANHAEYSEVVLKGEYLLNFLRGSGSTPSVTQSHGK